MDYFKAIMSLRPNALFSIEGCDYSTLFWSEDNDISAPSEEEVFNESKRLEEEAEKNQYQFKRMLAYPDFGSQLDIIYHQGLDAWREEINKVKEKYPKP